MPKKTKFFNNCVAIFQGGGCRAAAYVGAYKEASRRGISFSSIVGTSAGALIAALIGAGATPEHLENIQEDLDFKALLSPPEDICKDVNFWTKMYLSAPFANDVKPVITSLGLHSSQGIQDWLERQLAILIPGKQGPIKFKDLKIPTTVVATDLKTQKVRLWSREITPEEDVAFAVRTSCSIPFFFQPVNSRYVDGGVLSNLPTFVSSDFESIVLAFTLKSKVETAEIDDFKKFCIAIANSVVDGAQDLQLRFQKNVHVIDIDTGDIKSTDFNKITKENIKKLNENGVESVKNFIDNETIHYKMSRINSNYCTSHSQSYYQISQTVGKSIKDVIVSDLDSQWVYDLFPTLLYWAQKSANISAVFKSNNDNEVDGPFRKRILESMGVSIKEEGTLPSRCFLFNTEDTANSFAIVRRLQGVSNDDYDGVIYDAPTDAQVIRSLGAQFALLRSGIKSWAPTLEPVDDQEALSALRKVHQYNGESVSVYIAEIEVKEVTFLTNYVLGYKYRQISHFFEAYAKAGIKLFKPAKIVYRSGKESLVGLPVLEKYGHNLYLVNGNTRLKYCIQHDIKSIHAIIVEGVSEPLPTSNRYSHNEVIVTDRPVSGTARYGNFDYKQYRHIEKAFRDPITCMV